MIEHTPNASQVRQTTKTTKTQSAKAARADAATSKRKERADSPDNDELISIFDSEIQKLTDLITIQDNKILKQNSKLVNLNHQLTQENAELIGTVDSLKQQVVCLETRFNELEKTSMNVGNITDTNTSQNGVTWADSVKKTTLKMAKVVVNQSHARMKKENNLIIYGLPEDEIDTETKVKKLFSDVINEDIISNFKRITRLKNSNKSLPGPILLELNDKNRKIEILRSSKKLRNNKNYEKVFINNDMTKEERSHFKKLIADRTERNRKLQYSNDYLKYGLFKGKYYYTHYNI